MDKKQKTVATIQDISGFGKCSLTVALPIMSVASIATSVIPTALLSTHTGGIDGFTYHDLSDDTLNIAKHWKSLGLHFDAIYSGFLGSFKQIDITSVIFDTLKSSDTIIMLDPCFADNGKLYKTCTLEMVSRIKKLCQKADIIIPNLTEACFLLGIDYDSLKINKDTISSIAKSLCDFGCKEVIITGVSLKNSTLGAVCYDSSTEKSEYFYKEKIDGSYHGTGDIFASVFLSCLLNGIVFNECVKIAMDFTVEAIKRTKCANLNEKYGVDFEQGLADLGKLISKRKNND